MEALVDPAEGAESPDGNGNDSPEVWENTVAEIEIDTEAEPNVSGSIGDTSSDGGVGNVLSENLTVPSTPVSSLHSFSSQQEQQTKPQGGVWIVLRRPRARRLPRLITSWKESSQLHEATSLALRLPAGTIRLCSPVRLIMQSIGIDGFVTVQAGFHARSRYEAARVLVSMPASRYARRISPAPHSY
jgi:hypothetical protein